MPKKRFTPEEINGKLRHADVLLGQGKKVAEIVKVLGITEVTYFRWRQEFGGMSSRFLRRLRALTARKQGLRRPRHSSQRRCVLKKVLNAAAGFLDGPGSHFGASPAHHEHRDRCPVDIPADFRCRRAHTGTHCTPGAGGRDQPLPLDL